MRISLEAILYIFRLEKNLPLRGELKTNDLATLGCFQITTIACSRVAYLHTHMYAMHAVKLVSVYNVHI